MGDDQRQRQGGDGEARLELLSRFSRRASAAREPDEVLALLVDTSVEHLRARSAAVLLFDDDGALDIAARRGLPPQADRLAPGVDDLGLAARALLAAHGASARFARVFPLMIAGDLFGALVVFDVRPVEPSGPEGELVEVLVDLSAAITGHAVRYTALSRLYAQLKASREVLTRSLKLRALGQMSAGISHDLKNILNPISLYMQLLKKAIRRGDTETIDDAVEQIQGALRRGVEIIDRLRDFSRQSPESRTSIVDLDRLAVEAIELSRPRVTSAEKARVKIQAELGRAPPVQVQPSELVTALLNLILNAVDAVSPGGTIVVTTGERRGGGWVSVRDDGPGMSPEVEKQIFEPFFTTKGTEGTGLGLAMVYAFVQRHGGEITVASAPGQGATFTMWFPKVQVDSLAPTNMRSSFPPGAA